MLYFLLFPFSYIPGVYFDAANNIVTPLYLRTKPVLSRLYIRSQTGIERVYYGTPVAKFRVYIAVNMG